MWPFSRLKYTQSGRWFGTCFIFTYIGNFIIPTDELIFFRGVGQPPTRYESPIFVGYPTFWLTNVDNTYLLFWTIERNGIIIVIYILYIPFSHYSLLYSLFNGSISTQPTPPSWMAFLDVHLGVSDGDPATQAISVQFGGLSHLGGGAQNWGVSRFGEFVVRSDAA